MTINYRANVANRYEANALRGYAKANVRTTADSVAATAYAYAAAFGFAAGLVAWYLA